MKCPACHSFELKVLDSRHLDKIGAIRRRRECEKCKFKWNTFEYSETDLTKKLCLNHEPFRMYGLPVKIQGTDGLEFYQCNVCLSKIEPSSWKKIGDADVSDKKTF